VVRGCLGEANWKEMESNYNKVEEEESVFFIKAIATEFFYCDLGGEREREAGYRYYCILLSSLYNNLMYDF
jgi:hypothetical protein